MERPQKPRFFPKEQHYSSQGGSERTAPAPPFSPVTETLASVHLQFGDSLLNPIYGSRKISHELWKSLNFKLFFFLHLKLVNAEHGNDWVKCLPMQAG